MCQSFWLLMRMTIYMYLYSIVVLLKNLIQSEKEQSSSPVQLLLKVSHLIRMAIYMRLFGKAEYN